MELEKKSHLLSTEPHFVIQYEKIFIHSINING